MGQEVAEHWRKAFLKWQDWAEQLLKELGRQPPHGLHGDDAARQTIADLARKAPLPEKCIDCGHFFTRHDDKSECADCAMAPRHWE